MYLFAQHGYGKSDKIESGLRAGLIRGIVLSPRFERRSTLESFIWDLRAEFGEQVTMIFDPQFYAAALPDARAGRLVEYPYFAVGLTFADFKPSQIREYVASVTAYQAGLLVDRLVAPTVFIEEVNSRWSQIALSLAQEAIEVAEKASTLDTLLIPIVIDEAILKRRDDLDELLEEMTSWKVRGFLVTVRCTDTRYPALLSESQVANFMYFVYVLADRNQFEVVCTHSDFIGLLLQATGAFATTTGWHATQRQFSLKAFEAPMRGGQARERYSSAALLNSILVIPELSKAVDLQLGPRIVAATPYDEAIARDPGNAAWPTAQACLHHWAVLSRLIGELAAIDSTRDRVELVEQWVANALNEYRTIGQRGVEFEETTGPRNLERWQRALQSFKEEVLR